MAAGFPVKQHMNYALNYAKNIQQLKVEFERLTYTIQSLQLSIEEATRIGEVIEDGVEVWLSRAQKAATEIEEVIKATEEKNSCFIGLCPNFKRRYQLSRKARDEILYVVELWSEGKFENVSYLPVPKSISSTSVGNELALPSRLLISKAVLDALADDSINSVGIYGMAGSGKTTLAKEVSRRAIEDNLSDAVVMAVVAQKPNPRDIQQQIADQLGLTFEAETTADRARELHQRMMMEKKILVVLDDLWEKLDLCIIGIPSARDHNRCKLLLTSRSVHVLSTVMGTEKNFRLDVLSSSEAWTLFQNIAGDLRDPELQYIAIEIAKRCEGLPIAIATVAHSLRNKDLLDWKYALDQLSGFESSENSWERLVSALELSYNSLGAEHREIFLLCGLLGQTDCIRIADLLKYGVSLDLLGDKDKVEDARRRLHQLITDLKDFSLLLDSDMNGFINIHDIVYDFAIRTACRDHTFTVKAGDRLKDWPDKDTLKNCRKISLPRCDVRELPQRLECPELELLLLSTENPSLSIPDSFFEENQKLKVLDFSGISFLSPPSSLGSLTNLRTLCLDRCVLHDVAFVGKLKSLQILTFRNSDIVELPQELEQLGRLKLLDLSHCSKLKVIPAKVLSRLSLLEELYMIDSFSQWDIPELDSGSNASLAELEHLPYLINLEIRVPDAEMLPGHWMLKKLEKHRILVGDDLEWNSEEEMSKKLEIHKLNTDIHTLHGLNMLLKEAEGLYFDKVKGVKNVLHDLYTGIPTQLKHLSIQNVSELRYVTDSANNVPFIAFPILQVLELESLINLEHICLGKLAPGSFSSLTTIKVRNCNKLKHVFSSWMIRHLPRLEEMEVADCKDVEDIVAAGSEDDNKGKEATALFTRLNYLTLAGLPHVSSFFSTSKTARKQLTTDPDGGEIELSSPLFNAMDICPNLKNLSLSSIASLRLFPSAPSSYALFQNLTNLEVSNCSGMMNLVSSLVAERMEQLVSMRIQDCDTMKEIVADQQDEIPKMIIFLKLKTLAFVGLQNIRGFCLSNHSFNFPSLEEVIIAKCPRIRLFSAGVSTTPKLHKVLTEFPSTGESCWAGNLKDTIEQINMKIETVSRSQHGEEI